MSRGLHALREDGDARAAHRGREAEAARDGKGAVSLDGRLTDAASLRQAEHILAKVEAIEARNSSRPAAALF